MLRSATEYALTRFGQEGDCRLASCAEVYHLVALVRARPELRSPAVTDGVLAQVRTEIERRIRAAVYDAVGGDRPVRLVREPSQPHMAGYYTWWLLDGSGELLLHDPNSLLGPLAEELVIGLDQLGMETPGEGLGFPLTLGGVPDPGVTAQIGDVLLRLSSLPIALRIGRMLNFLRASLTEESIRHYRHRYLLWSIPVFVERQLTVLDRAKRIDR